MWEVHVDASVSLKALNCLCHYSTTKPLFYWDFARQNVMDLTTLTSTTLFFKRAPQSKSFVTLVYFSHKAQNSIVATVIVTHTISRSTSQVKVLFIKPFSCLIEETTFSQIKAGMEEISGNLLTKRTLQPSLGMTTLTALPLKVNAAFCFCLDQGFSSLVMLWPCNTVTHL